MNGLTEKCCTALHNDAAIQHFLLPCPFKLLTSWDCPGCGFQRSVLALFRGDFSESLYLYPATIPLLFLFAAGILLRFFPYKISPVLVKALMLLCGTIIVCSYALKIWQGRAH